MGEVLRNLGSSGAVYYGDVAGTWTMILHRPPQQADMLAARPTLARMARAYPAGFPTLTWVLPSAGFSLDAASREAASQVTAEYAKSILSRATLIEGTGFQAAAVRAIVTGIDFVSRTTSPGKVFADLESSLAWSEGYLPSSPYAAPLLELAAALRDQVAKLLAESA